MSAHKDRKGQKGRRARRKTRRVVEFHRQLDRMFAECGEITGIGHICIYPDAPLKQPAGLDDLDD